MEWGFIRYGLTVSWFCGLTVTVSLKRNFPLINFLKNSKNTVKKTFHWFSVALQKLSTIPLYGHKGEFFRLRKGEFSPISLSLFRSKKSYGSKNRFLERKKNILIAYFCCFNFFFKLPNVDNDFVICNWNIFILDMF